MQWKPRPVYQSLPEIYVVVSFLLFLAWVAALLLPLPDDLNPEGVLRILLNAFMSIVALGWGVLGLLLARRRLPTLDLGLVLCSNPLFMLIVWMSQPEYRIVSLLLFTCFFLMCFLRLVWRVFFSVTA